MFVNIAWANSLTGYSCSLTKINRVLINFIMGIEGSDCIHSKHELWVHRASEIVTDFRITNFNVQTTLNHVILYMRLEAHLRPLLDLPSPVPALAVSLVLISVALPLYRSVLSKLAR